VTASTDSRPGDSNFLTFPTSCEAPRPQPEDPVKPVPLAVASVLAVGLSWFVWASYGAKLGVLLILGLLLGLALFHSRFGFVSSSPSATGRGCERTRCCWAPPRPSSR